MIIFVGGHAFRFEKITGTYISTAIVLPPEFWHPLSAAGKDKK